MQNGFAPSSWLRSGEALIGHRDGDLWIYKPSDGSNKWERLTDNPAQERYPAWSPDGTWLAYVSDVSGRDEVYVQRYPKSDSPILVSTAGGHAPVWNAHGRELIYVETIAFDQAKDPGRQQGRRFDPSGLSLRSGRQIERHRSGALPASTRAFPL